MTGSFTIGLSALIEYEAKPASQSPKSKKVAAVTECVTPDQWRVTPEFSLSAPSQLLSLRDLSVAFNAGKAGEHRVLNQVSLDIAPGEVVGLVGESGSGKTVLSHTILGLLPRNGNVTSGSIEFGGRNLLQLPESSLRKIRGKEIAMIFQDPQASLNPVYPVGRQMEWILKLHRGIVAAEAKAEVLSLFESVKLRDPERCIRAYPHELSGGMCQRVMIAMALAGRPRLLIADEPTSALDVSVAVEIVKLLSRLSKELGLSILIITHDLNVAARLSDRLAVFDQGRAVEVLPSKHFLSRAQHPSSRILIEASQFLGSASNLDQADKPAPLV